MLDVGFDAEGTRLTVRRSGLTGLEEAMRYEERIRSLLASRPRLTEPFDVLIDVSDGAVIPQQAVSPPLRVSNMLLEAGARRVAMVTGRAISRMQLRRLLGENARIRLFDTAEDAEEWLRS